MEWLMLREVVPGVLTWSWFSKAHGYHFNGYLLRSAEGNLCIDPVPPGEAELAEIVREGVARILITNRNHSRAANAVRQATGARTGIHPADAAHAAAQGLVIDDGLKVGSDIGALRVLGVPGKSPGEVAFYWPARHLVFVGDAVIGDPPGGLRLLPEAKLDDPKLLRRSLRTLLELDVDALLVGDGVPLISGAGAKLAALVAGFAE
jgi:glyoxylase-like metal-dependent hydrolase (beta-lactamase superfamily II)